MRRKGLGFRAMLWMGVAAAAAAFAGPSWAQGAPPGPFSPPLSEDPLRAPGETAGPDRITEETAPGDNKQFPVKTENNITELKVGDKYRSSGCEFTVESIQSQGEKGGSFTLKRTRGTIDPDRRLTWTGPKPKDRNPPDFITTQVSLWDYYWMGGFFMHPIALLMFVMIVLIASSVWIYRPSIHVPPAFVDKAREHLAAGNVDEFDKLAQASKGLFPTICRAMVSNFETSTPEDIRRRTETIAGSQIERLRFPVKFLNIISVAAPLMGLLGTIVGMAIVFEAVGSATGAAKATALAAGIRVKLFCTAMALMVAIPSLFSYFIFNSVLNNIAGKCEFLTEEFLHRFTILKNGSSAAAADVYAAAGRKEGRG
jgi:biopolymer transport protein ExbB